MDNGAIPQEENRRMDLFGRYHNYELHPVKEIVGFENEAWEGVDQVSAQLSGKYKDIEK